MKPSARRLFTLCSAAAAVLCAATVAAWVDSHFYTHAIWCSRPTWSVSVLSKQGGFIVYLTGRVSRTGWIHMRQPTDNSNWPVRYDELFDRHAFGFGWAAGKPSSTGPAYGFAVPYWAPAGFLAMAAWLAWRSRSRPACGMCPTCGYDLRASPERCPECGTSTAKRAETPAI